MVLLRTFVFFFSILFYALRIESASVKSEIDLVQESIEERLKAYSNDSDKIRYLIQKMAKDRVSHKQELIDVVAKVCWQGANETVHKEHTAGLSLKQALDLVLRACLTSKALGVLERFAFFSGLYKNTDMDLYEKWVFVLKLVNTPILDNIRADLQQSNLSCEEFASAAYMVHSLIPEEYVEPVLQTCTSYHLPTKKEDVETFCSFLDMYLADKYNGTRTSSLKRAADLVCLSAFKYLKGFERTKAAEKAKKYAATIIIDDANFEMCAAVEKFLDKIIKGETYKDVVTKLKSQCKLQPNTGNTRRSCEMQIVFLLACKATLKMVDDLGTHIQQELSKQFPGKEVRFIKTPTS